MTLVKWKTKPTYVYDEMSNMIDSAFDRDWKFDLNSSHDYTLAVDIKETDNSFIIFADIPGLTKKDIKVKIVDKMLNITGERVSEPDQNNDYYHYRERQIGLFNRSFKLPESVDEEKISANFKNGILKIELQKHKNMLPVNRDIKVN